MNVAKFYEFDLEDVKKHEYDGALYGFTLQDFMTAIKLLVKEEVTYYAEGLKKSLLRKYPNDPEIDQVKETILSLINEYTHASIEPLKRLEAQLKELMHIPPHVLLPCDKAQQVQFTAEDEQELDQETQELLDQIKRTKILEVELSRELKTLRIALPKLKKEVNQLEITDMEREENIPIMEKIDPTIDLISGKQVQSMRIDDEQ